MTDSLTSRASRRPRLLSWRGLAGSSSVLLAALALSACADMAGIQPQAQPRDAASLGLPAAPADADAVAVPQARWWRDFGDERLDQLVEQALAGNPSIGLAQARLASAWAQAGVTGSALRPQLNGEVDVTRQRYTENGAVPSPLAGSVQNVALAQLGLSWELDLFGRQRAALDAAVGSARAAQADAQAAQLLLASQVVSTYVELAQQQALLAVAERTLAQRSQTFEIVRDRFQAGLDTHLELQQSGGGLPESRFEIEQVRERIALTQHALAALIGVPGQAATLHASALAQLRLPALPQALPANLLGRRADIAAARWRVEAARQGVTQARAAFYPDINLSAFVGLSSLGFDRWLESGSRQWGVGPAISLPIFEGGRLRAQLGGRAADYDAAVEAYNQAVIGAVHDTADQLTSVEAVQRQQQQQAEAAAAAQSAYDIARQRYAAGLGTYLNVLSAETQVLSQQRQSVALAGRALQTRVGLAHALGGGYDATAVDGGVAPLPTSFESESTDQAARLGH